MVVFTFMTKITVFESKFEITYDGMWGNSAQFTCVLSVQIWLYCHIPLSYRVRSQGDSAPTAGTELRLAVRTQVPAAICELGLATDATRRRVVPVNG